MSNALLFPGQGSQSVGMGKELYETIPEARDLLDSACKILGYDLKKLMFEGPIEELTDTKTAQPAIYTCSAMHLAKGRLDGVKYDYVAGHSLGEYSALYAAGVFGFEEGLRLIDRRARAMAAENGKGTMAAVLGPGADVLKRYLEAEPDVVMANLNTKIQTVISGTIEGIERVEKALTRDEITCKRLAVSADFHSPQMEKAAAVMKDAINAQSFSVPECYVVSNVSGKASKDPNEIKKNLIAQITGQVHWWESVLAMKDAGVELFYECGNGNVLRRMNKLITMQPKCVTI